ncbi:MAG: hypothetical protein LCH93_08995 [Proteobacteria bacterium]|nr:hypothetical protein [Pseudomonadota bacterium]
MRGALVFVAGTLAALTAPALAKTYPSVAAAKDAYRAELAKDCVEVGSTLEIRPGFVREVDLNGDGIPDAILSNHHADCATAPAPFALSGSSGEATRWVVSVPGGFETLEFVYQKVEIERSGGARRITLSLRGGESAGSARSTDAGASSNWTGRGSSPRLGRMGRPGRSRRRRPRARRRAIPSPS